MAQKNYSIIETAMQMQFGILIVRITESFPNVKASKTVSNRQVINIVENLIEGGLGILFC